MDSVGRPLSGYTLDVYRINEFDYFHPHRMQSCVTKNTEITKETIITNFKAAVDGVGNSKSSLVARPRPPVSSSTTDTKDFTKERGRGPGAVQVKTIIRGLPGAVAQKNGAGGGRCRVPCGETRHKAISGPKWS